MVTRFDQRGGGVVGSFFGAIAFLAFLALATHTLISLYATSVITSVAWDDAQRVASGRSDVAVVEADLRDDLRGFKNVDVQWTQDTSGSIGLSVSADRPMLLPKSLAEAAELTRIKRTVWVRNEELR